MYILITSLCETSAVLKTIRFLSELLKIVLFLVPMILIVMVSIDIGKAVIANDESEMKKAGHTAIRRIIMGMFLILIPRITVPLISLLVNASSTVTNYNNCIENMKNISLYEKLEQSEREEEQETYQKKLSKKTSKKIKAMEKANNTTLKANDNKNSASLNTGNTFPDDPNTDHRILIIGNSKTWRNGGMPYEKSERRPAYEFVKMAKLGGYIKDDNLKIFYTNGNTAKIRAGNSEVTVVTIPGSTINYISSKSKQSENYLLISKFNYDIVILQEKTASAQNSSNATFKAGVKRVLNALKNKNARIYIRTSWPTKGSFGQALSNMNSNVDSIISDLKSSNNYSSFTFVPIRDGNAFKQAYNKQINTYLPDHQHQNGNGSYLAGACMYYKVFNADPSELNFKGHAGSKDVAKKLAEIAKQNC